MMFGVMLRGFAVVAVLGGAFAVSADLASACSCADVDERDRLEAGERAIVGRVLEERALDDERREFAYRVRVERSVGVRLSGEIELRLEDFGACGAPVVGRRQGIFIRRRAGRWVSDGCSIVQASALTRALRPYRPPAGSGRLALLAAGSFGDARLMALDARGRVLGYGFGEGETRAISVCPGAARSAELVVGPRAVSVALRDLRTLEVIRSAPLPFQARRFDPGIDFPIRCDDADGAAVHIAVGDYIRRTRFDRMRIFRFDAAGVHRVATLEGSTAALGAGAAYVGRYNEAIFAVDLATGATRRVTGVRSPEPMALSPDGSRLAVFDRDRLRVIDVATGQKRSLKIRYGGVLDWLDAGRLLFRASGTALLYDPELRRLRRYPFVRMYGQAHVAGRLYGTNRYRLRALDLGTGRRRTVASLTDRGIADLAGVPEQPLIEPGTRRPDAAGASRRRSSSSARRCRPATSAPAPGRRPG
jgi:hypothetical protein